MFQEGEANKKGGEEGAPNHHSHGAERSLVKNILVLQEGEAKEQGGEERVLNHRPRRGERSLVL